MHRYCGILSALVALLPACSATHVGAGPVAPPQCEAPPPPEPAAPATFDEELAALLGEHGIDRQQIACSTRVAPPSGHVEDGVTLAAAMQEHYLPQLRRLREPDAEELGAAVTATARAWLARREILHGGHHNLGAVVIPSITWTGEDGTSRPFVVFHSGLAASPADEGSCVRSLLSAGQVRRVLSLVGGQLPVRDLLDAERDVVEAAGAAFTDVPALAGDAPGWQGTVRDPEATDEALEGAREQVAALLREQVLEPAGGRPHGNVYIHCGRGTRGAVVLAGILRRCVAEVPDDGVLVAMRHHAGWSSPESPGDLTESVTRFVETFDCAALRPPPPPPPDPEPEPQGDSGPAAPEDGGETPPGGGFLRANPYGDD